MQYMATAEITPKSPFIPLFQRGEFSPMLQPLFGKGEGEIFDSSSANFRYTTLVGAKIYDA
jgi:hypothetical protein